MNVIWGYLLKLNLPLVEVTSECGKSILWSAGEAYWADQGKTEGKEMNTE